MASIINSYLAATTGKLWKDTAAKLRDEKKKQESTTIDISKPVQSTKPTQTTGTTQSSTSSESKPSSASSSQSSKINSEYEKKLLSAASAQSDVQKKIDTFLGNLTEKYDAFLDKLTGESYKDTDYYNSIKSQYEGLGEKMAYGAAASTASSNAGNFDSVGAANAHRQMLSYTNAGEQAARDAYAEELDRYTKSLGGYASDLTNVYKLLSDSADKADDYDISLLDALEGYRKLEDEKEIANKKISASKSESIAKDMASELDKKNLTNRYMTYAGILSQLYPDYASEIQRVFFGR